MDSYSAAAAVAIVRQLAKTKTRDIRVQSVLKEFIE